MVGKVKVRFLGIFKKAYGSGEVSLEAADGERLTDLLGKAVGASSELRNVLIDRELSDPRPNAVILVNGREIGLLKGLETDIRDGDEIVLIPVTHGG